MGHLHPHGRRADHEPRRRRRPAHPAPRWRPIQVRGAGAPRRGRRGRAARPSSPPSCAAAGVRVELDDKVSIRRSAAGPPTGSSRACPVRLELGPRDLADGEVTVVRRDRRRRRRRSPLGRHRRRPCRRSSTSQQAALLAEATERRETRTADVTTLDEAVEAAATGFARIPWSTRRRRGRGRSWPTSSVTVRCLLRPDGEPPGHRRRGRPRRHRRPQLLTRSGRATAPATGDPTGAARRRAVGREGVRRSDAGYAFPAIRSSFFEGVGVAHAFSSSRSGFAGPSRRRAARPIDRRSPHDGAHVKEVHAAMATMLDRLRRHRPSDRRRARSRAVRPRVQRAPPSGSRSTRHRSTACPSTSTCPTSPPSPGPSPVPSTSTTRSRAGTRSRSRAPASSGRCAPRATSSGPSARRSPSRPSRRRGRPPAHGPAGASRRGRRAAADDAVDRHARPRCSRTARCARSPTPTSTRPAPSSSGAPSPVRPSPSPRPDPPRSRPSSRRSRRRRRWHAS